MAEKGPENKIFPRVLVVSSSVFNQYTGGGVMLTNIFRGWPEDRLAIVHGDYFAPDFSVCKNIYKLNPIELHPTFPFHLFYRSRGSQHQEAESRKKTFIEKLISLFKNGIKKVLKMLFGPEMPWEAKISTELAAWIDQFKPDVIYTLVGGPYMRLSVEISEKWNIPIASHMMDDWPAQLTNSPMLFSYYRNKSLSDLQALFRKSALRMCICDLMGEAYEKRYGYKFLSFQNSVDSQGRLPFSRKNWHTNEGFKLTYIGSILPNAQLYSLSDIAKAVTQLSQQGFKIELNIYSPWAKTFENELQISASVHLYPPLDEASIFPCLTSSDLLVLPVNFDKKSLEYIRYSMPAKVPLYLISGTPILVYGPPEVASVDYATKESWGFVVSQNEQDVLMNGIKELMKSEAKREQLGRTAMSVAQKNHDSSMEKEEFCQKLAQIVKGIE